MTTKLEGRGKALVAGPLKTDRYFFAASLIHFKNIYETEFKKKYCCVTENAFLCLLFSLKKSKWYWKFALYKFGVQESVNVTLPTHLERLERNKPCFPD